MDDEELAILREAGIVAQPGKKQKRKRSSTKGHILFADTEEQGKLSHASLGMTYEPAFASHSAGVSHE